MFGPKHHPAYEVFLELLRLVIVLVFSWLVTAFVTWLISLCFGIEFSFAIATGVWLILLVLQAVFRGSSQ